MIGSATGVFEGFCYFGLVIFWRWNIGTKAARKMLVKLTIGGMLKNNYFYLNFFSTCKKQQFYHKNYIEFIILLKIKFRAF